LRRLKRLVDRIPELRTWDLPFDFGGPDIYVVRYRKDDSDAGQKWLRERSIGFAVRAGLVISSQDARGVLLIFTQSQQDVIS
jgi:hypothetical protein